MATVKIGDAVMSTSAGREGWIGEVLGIAEGYPQKTVLVRWLTPANETRLEKESEETLVPRQSRARPS